MNGSLDSSIMETLAPKPRVPVPSELRLGFRSRPRSRLGTEDLIWFLIAIRTSAREFCRYPPSPCHLLISSVPGVGTKSLDDGSVDNVPFGAFGRFQGKPEEFYFFRSESGGRRAARCGVDAASVTLTTTMDFTVSVTCICLHLCLAAQL